MITWHQFHSSKFHHPVSASERTRKTASRSSKGLKISMTKVVLLVGLPCIGCALRSHPGQRSGGLIQRAADRGGQPAEHLGIGKGFPIRCRQLPYSCHSNSQPMRTRARKGENRQVEIEPMKSVGRNIPSAINYSSQTDGFMVYNIP